ncbi:MAG: MFS transporter [Patescibacteria group bacterium]|nr:MFS transporter [Patescibacteria group bacterium]
MVITNQNKGKSFLLILGLYFTVYFYIGILPANIDNLITDLSGTTQSGIGLVIVLRLVSGTISLLVFGYFSESLSDRFGKKRVFLLTNAFSIAFNGLIIFSMNYSYFLILSIATSIANGAFLPVGFSMVSELYTAKERGKKFGMLQFSLVLGNGLGVALGGLVGWRFGFIINFIMGILCLGGYFMYGYEPQQTDSESGVRDYDYKITISNVLRLLKTKTVAGIFISVFCYGIAISTLANWGIFYLTSQLGSETEAILLYSITGLGALPGAIIGGELGDIYFHSGKPRARIYISLGGLILGICLLLSFYLQPLLLLGFFGYFFISFANGNQFALYSDVSAPELRGTVNALSGIMLNIGGITGNMLVSTLIRSNLLHLSIILVLVIWLLGSFSWIIPYFFYNQESESQRAILVISEKLV